MLVFNGVPATDVRACSAYYAVVADPWQLERKLSLSPLVDQSWARKSLDAIEQHTVMVGMTRAMVVASIGYPTCYGTIRDLDKLDESEYRAAAPFGSDVYFRNGVVYKYNPPGQLP